MIRLCSCHSVFAALVDPLQPGAVVGDGCPALKKWSKRFGFSGDSPEEYLGQHESKWNAVTTMLLVILKVARLL